MNREYPCEVIQDLLPGYIDGILSKTGADAVKEHLKECDGCRRCHEEMAEEIHLASDTRTNFEEQTAISDESGNNNDGEQQNPNESEEKEDAGES